MPNWRPNLGNTGLVASPTALWRKGGGGAALVGLGGSSYIGQVAGQVMQPQGSFLAATATQVMVRKPVYAREDITSLRLVYPNWYLDNATLTEMGTGGPLTVTAGIEYPINVTNTQVKWGGSAAVVIPDLSNSPESDSCVVSIPAGSKFMIRTYATSSVAIPMQNRTGCVDAGNTGSCRFALSGLADQTTGINVTSGGTLTNNFMYNPLIVAGPTTKPSILILGDSRQEGSASAEGYTGTSGDIGTIARCVGPYFAYCNLGKGSDSALKFLAGNTLRSSIRDYFSHVISGYGINDVITLSRTAIATYADILAIRALFPRQRFYQLTLSPLVTTTSNAYTSVAGQTTSVRNSERVAFNALVLAASGIDGKFDVTPVCENTPNVDGRWIVPANARTVTDAAMTSGLTNLASATASFVAGDTGGCVVCVALGLTSALNRTMTLVDAINVTMSGAATATLAAQTAFLNAQKYTWDGTHEATFMNNLYLSSNVIPQASITL